uniref:D-cysteine desulfhydrase n=1 Tax=Opuntia streptacantha TaxID=393608 RepID=A0A7C9EGV4_OPUST
MLVRHASIVAGSSGSVLWFTDILDDLAGLFDGRNCVQTNLKDGMKKVVIINEGAGDAVALLGVIRLVHYLSQSHVLGKERPYNFVIDAGTGTTAIGFALGAQMLGLPWKVTSVMLADTVDWYKAQEQKLISDFKKYYASDIMDSLLEDELVEWVYRTSPRKFGKVLDGELKACQQVANQTGVLVDPIYTLAAWELAVHLSQRELKEGRRVVMLHTGGTLGMFGLAQRFKSYFSTLKDHQPSNFL